MSSTNAPESRASPASVIIVGNDAGVAARPATPVQLAHACLSAGYHAVVPESWGDELVAAACIRRLAERPRGPAIFCDCPCVAHRLLATGSDLGRFFISLVAPPVAAARYVRALYAPHEVRLTYVGRCPGAVDGVIDARFTPAAFLDTLAERGIDPLAQPEVFDSVLPPDRRRHHSLPGGLPSPEALQAAGLPYTVTELQGETFALDLAQTLLSSEPSLIDLGMREGCWCAGAVTPELRRMPDDARALITSTEPPRSPTPVVDEAVPIELDFPLPVATRAPAELSLAAGVAERRGPPPAGRPAAPAAASAPTPPREPVTAPRRRSPAGGITRPVTGVGPFTRNLEGRVLPRAYLARRRSPPGVPRITGEPPARVPHDVPRELPRGVEPPRAPVAPRDGESRTTETRQAAPPAAPRAPIAPPPPPPVPPETLAAPAGAGARLAGERIVADESPARAAGRVPQTFSLQHVILIVLVAAAIVLLSVVIGLAAGRWLAHVTSRAPAATTALAVAAAGQRARDVSAGGFVRLIFSGG